MSIEFKVGNKYVFENPALPATSRSIRKLVYKGEYEMCFETELGELMSTHLSGKCVEGKYGNAVELHRDAVVAYAILDADGSIFCFSRTPLTDDDVSPAQTVITLKEVQS